MYSSHNDHYILNLRKLKNHETVLTNLLPNTLQKLDTMGKNKSQPTVIEIESEENSTSNSTSWTEAVILAFNHPSASEILNDENLDIITIQDPDNINNDIN